MNSKFCSITFAHCNAVTLLIKWTAELCNYESVGKISSIFFSSLDRISTQITITISLDNVLDWWRLAEECEIIIFRPFQTLCIVNGQLFWMCHHVCIHISVGRMIGFLEKIHCAAAILRAKFHRALFVWQTAFFKIFHIFYGRRQRFDRKKCSQICGVRWYHDQCKKPPTQRHVEKSSIVSKAAHFLICIMLLGSHCFRTCKINKI